MQKSYFNNAITGNSSVLACFSDKAELLRLYWPDIDKRQQCDKFLCGIFTKYVSNSTVWLNDASFEFYQRYIEDTNIINTTIKSWQHGFIVDVYDLVHPNMDVLLRHFQIKNISQQSKELGFVSFSAASSTHPEMTCSLFDFKNEALIQYCNDNYVSIFSDYPAMQYQLGNCSYDAAINTYLNGAEEISMSKDAAVSWDLGVFSPNETKHFNIYVSFGESLRNCKNLIKKIRSQGSKIIYSETEEYWRTCIAEAAPIKSNNAELFSLYKRSILVFKLMYNKRTGGLMAAPEVDEYFRKSGRYAYCWGRDAAFITTALDICGMSHCVDNFYKWAVNTQDEDGSWQQRYHMDGNLAPCWGLQIDETASIIWGMLSHYYITGSREFLEYVWDNVEAAINFLLDFIDSDTGLPKPSFDLWEERLGEHAYSSAAVHAGIVSGAKIAHILNKPTEISKKWNIAADKLKEAIEDRFWKEDYKRFIRSIKVKLNGFGPESSNDTEIITVNNKGYTKDVTKEDWKVDVSLVGISVPFDVYSSEDPKIRSTVELIEKVLTCNDVGGIKRYENDDYMGGNPWILTTLWLALYHVKNRDYDKAKKYINWSAAGKTEMGMLPEQINKYTGKPDWIIPLTWSHAMYVHVYSELVKAGII